MPGVKGKSGGRRPNAGRKTKAEEAGLEHLLNECWTGAERKKALKKLASDCNSRDFKIRNESRKLLLAYCYGRPKERHDVNNFDYTEDDLRLLNDYELQRLIAGDDARSVFAASRARRIREAAKTI